MIIITNVNPSLSIAAPQAGLRAKGMRSGVSAKITQMTVIYGSSRVQRLPQVQLKDPRRGRERIIKNQKSMKERGPDWGRLLT